MTNTSGTISFAEIPQLPENWWDNPASAWTVWDKDTYYLWGANAINYDTFDPDESLAGSGMAGPEHGPTRGRGNSNYIGIITTSNDDSKNDAVFASLAAHLAAGKNIVVPTYKGKFSLGTGIAVDWFSQPSDWWQSQAYILGKIRDLMKGASATKMAPGDFWPDCAGATDCKDRAVSASSPGARPMTSAAELDAIIAYLDSKS